MTLTEILAQVQQELVKKDEMRQEIHKAMHKATRLSKQAIFSVHKTKFEDAENLLGEAANMLSSLTDLTRNNPGLFYMGTVDAAFQEYTEACVFLGLIKAKRFVDFQEIRVPMTSYVLGLADVIGELRRRALDSLRRDEARTAEECLELMETIYMELINMDEINFLIPGLRNKCDTARRVIEATRGDITIDLRKRTLENSMNRLKETLEAKKQE